MGVPRRGAPLRRESRVWDSLGFVSGLHLGGISTKPTDEPLPLVDEIGATDRYHWQKARERPLRWAQGWWNGQTYGLSRGRYRYRHMSAHGMITTCRAARAAAVRAGLRQHRQGRGLCQGSPALQDRPGGGRRKQYRVQPLRERPTGSQHQWRRLGARRKPALLAAAAASHEPHITVRILMIRHSCTGIRRRTRSEACEGHLAVDAAACNNAD